MSRFVGTWEQYEPTAPTWEDAETDEVTWAFAGELGAATMGAG